MMTIRLDASQWVPALNADGDPVASTRSPDVTIAGTVDGRATRFSLDLSFRQGSYQGNVHSGITGWTEFRINGMIEV